jgi:hypothetical protein
MSKKKDTNVSTPTVESMINALDLASISGPVVHFSNDVRGKVISLNQKLESFFGVGKVWLSSKNYSCTVPADASTDDVLLIKEAIAKGILVEGDVYIPPIDRNPSVLEEYWSLVKTYGLETTNDKSPAMIKFRKLLRHGVDRNWTGKEIAAHCIRQEEAYKHRPKIIQLLKEFQANVMCPDTLLESK